MRSASRRSAGVRWRTGRGGPGVEDRAISPGPARRLPAVNARACPRADTRILGLDRAKLETEATPDLPARARPSHGPDASQPGMDGGRCLGVALARRRRALRRGWAPARGAEEPGLPVFAAGGVGGASSMRERILIRPSASAMARSSLESFAPVVESTVSGVFRPSKGTSEPFPPAEFRPCRREMRPRRSASGLDHSHLPRQRSLMRPMRRSNWRRMTAGNGA